MMVLIELKLLVEHDLGLLVKIDTPLWLGLNWPWKSKSGPYR